ncbi:unnamed protein product [Blepharisma stoltei]|uniref:Uncharacterized protein n=1 Tax=Blepharisma stoltei TaxID=1481888 RepID=A0AAU9IJW2_9CILI|nr:unnamed protein product [Blepharisma stoltei]
MENKCGYVISLESNTIISGVVLRDAIHVALYKLLSSPSIYLSYKRKEITKSKAKQCNKEMSIKVSSNYAL